MPSYIVYTLTSHFIKYTCSFRDFKHEEYVKTTSKI